MAHWQAKQNASGAFLPLREIRNCLPEFSLINLTVYSTVEIKNSYRGSDKLKLCNFDIDSFFITVAEECAYITHAYNSIIEPARKVAELFACCCATKINFYVKICCSPVSPPAK